MTNILIGYYSHSGNTRKLAQAIARGVKQAGAAVNCQSVVQIRIKSLFHYDAIILGSPTYYGQMAAPMKLFIDKSVKLHGRLAGKIAGAFTTSGGTHCGAETCLLSLLNALLIHGMIIIGDASNQHYGPVAVGAPSPAALNAGRLYGQRIARLTMKLVAP